MQPNSFNESVAAICEEDPRYDAEAYLFLRDALDAAAKRRRKVSKDESQDVPAADLLDGCRRQALKEYGPMARSVLDYWGVRTTSDIGNLVFNLVEAQVFSKTDLDTAEAFADGFDFKMAFDVPFRPEGKKLSESADPAVKPD